MARLRATNGFWEVEDRFLATSAPSGVWLPGKMEASIAVGCAAQHWLAGHVGGPVPYVAEHVVKAELARRFGSNRVGHPFAVCGKPRGLVEIARAQFPVAGNAGAAGQFPFGLGREPIFLFSTCGKPPAEHRAK